MRQHPAISVLTLIFLTTLWCSRAESQELELPQPLTSLLSSGAYFTSGGLRFSNFAILPSDRGETVDTAMLQQARVDDDATSGFGGIRIGWGDPGVTTLPTRTRRSLSLSFKVSGSGPSEIKEVNVLVAGQGTNYAVAGATAYVSDDTDDDTTNLRPISSFASVPSVPGSWIQSAARFEDAGPKVVRTAGVSLSMVAESIRSNASASLTAVSLRLSSGKPRLAGDFDLNGHVDGQDFLLWQRTLGSQENLAADANINSSVDAADLVIWRDTFGGQIGPPGDFDVDGDVDGADFLTWQRAFGSNDPKADANKNGIVDIADYTIWRNNFGTDGGSQPITASVPEPAAWILGVAGLAIAWTFARSRR